MIVRVNDRGPFHGNRVIDLSHKTADLLGFKGNGVARVRVEYVGRASLDGSDDRKLVATLRQGEPAPAPSAVRVAVGRAVYRSRRSSEWPRGCADRCRCRPSGLIRSARNPAGDGRRRPDRRDRVPDRSTCSPPHCLRSYRPMRRRALRRFCERPRPILGHGGLQSCLYWLSLSRLAKSLQSQSDLTEFCHEAGRAFAGVVFIAWAAAAYLFAALPAARPAAWRPRPRKTTADSSPGRRPRS